MLLIPAIGYTQPKNEPLCPPKDETLLETITIKRVVDGDTVHARSGEKIRVIGVNTPELFPKLQPLAQQARRATTRFLEQSARVAMIVGENTYDQHNRILAHIYRITDSGHVQSLAAYLLHEGLGFGIARAEHAQNWPCLKAIEDKARLASKNIWGIKKSPFVSRRPKPGFSIVRAKVMRSSINERGAVIYLNNGLNVYIRAEYLSYFEGNLRKYTLKTVEARGWISRSKSNNKYRMHISHPDMLVIQ